MSRRNRRSADLSPAAREDAAARQLLEQHARTLEAKVAKLREGAEIADYRLVNLWDRFTDGDRILAPGGYPNDRKAGGNWPTLVDENGLRQMRAFSRLLCETNPYAIGFRDHVRNFVVGTGYGWQVVLRGQKTGAVAVGFADRDGDGKPDADPDVSECQQVLDEFRRMNGWGDDAEARADQDLDGFTTNPVNRERETYERAMEEGESLLRLFAGDDNTYGVPYLRPVEVDCLKCPPNYDQQGAWSWGILNYEETTRFGTVRDVERIEAYHFEEPDAPGALGEIVPAGHVLHFRLNAKSTVKRGVPDFWPIEDELKGSRTLVRNMIAVAGTLSAIAYIRQHAPATTADQVRTLIGQGAQSALPNRNVPLLPAGADATRYLTIHQAGTIIDISNQLQYQPGPITTGVPGFIQAAQATLRCIGLRWSCPEYFSGDGSNANMASTLIAGGPFERATSVRQGDYKLFQGQLAVRVLMFAVKSGRLKKAQLARVAVKVTAPPVAIANKKEDTDRRKVLFDAGVLDAQTWIAEEGHDPAQVVANRQAWLKMFPPAGQGVNATEPAPDPFAALLGESIQRLLEDIGPAPFPGAVFDRASHRWKKTDGTDAGPPKGAALDLPDAAKPKVASALERATLRVASILYRVDRLVPTVRAALEGIFDTDEDLQKGYYRPGTGSGGGNASYDAAASELGVSTNTLGLLLVKAVPAVLAKCLKSKGKKMAEEEAKGGIDEGAALLAEIFAAVAEEFGIDPGSSVVDAESLRAIVAERVAKAGA
jgi:hypothetical protein